MDIREYLSGIEGVAANGNATINCPVSRRYKGIKLFATGTDGVNPLDAVDIVDGVQVIVGKVTMIDLTADQLRRDYLSNLKLAASSPLIASEIPIAFAEPGRASVTDENVTAYDTFGVDTMTIKVKIKAGVTNPAITALAVFDYLRSQMGEQVVVQPLKKYAVSIIAPGGKVDITQIQPKNPVQRIYLDGTQNITAVEVVADSARVFEGTTEENARFLADYAIDASQFKYPVVFDYTQQLFAGALVVRKDLNIRAWSAAAQTITAVVVERLSRYE